MFRPPHTHHRAGETSYVLEGEMTFSIGDQTIKAAPGTLVFAPRDVVHSFAIDSESGADALGQDNLGSWFIVLR